MNRLYETMYILRPDLAEQDVDAAIARYQTFLQDREADEIAIQHRGKRRLAYEIGKHREGVYVQMNYSAKPSTIAVMEKSMGIDDQVIRYLTVKLESDKTVEVEDTEESTPEAVAMQRGPEVE